MRYFLLAMLIVGFNIISKASNKIYFLHGYGGPGFEMNRILKAVEKSGFDCSLFKYRSLVKDIDLVGLDFRPAFAIYCFTIDSDSPLFICQLRKPHYE